MRLGILRLYMGNSGSLGFYNLQELGLAKALVRNGEYEVDIFLLRDKKKYPKQEIVHIHKEIRLIYLPASHIGTHGVVNPDFLKQFNIDILHLNSDVQLCTSSFIKWCLKNNIYIYTFTGTLGSNSSNLIKNLVLKVIFKRNKKFLNKVYNVAKTPYVFNHLKNKGIKNVRLISVGLDIYDLRDQLKYDKTELRKKYGIPVDTKLLLYVGRLEEEKRPLMAIKVFKEIQQLGEEYSLLIVGSGSLKEKVFNKVKSENLSKKVYYFEKIPNKNMSEIYQMSDVLINPSSFEIFGMSILEAMFNKCPVIAARAPGPSFIIENNETGYIIDDEKLKKWVVAIKNSVINKDRIGEKSREKVYSDFNWDVISMKYITLHQTLMTESLE